MSKNIYEAMNAVMQEVGYVQKTRSGGVKYSFAGEAALIAALRPALVEHGIVVFPHRINKYDQDAYTTSRGAVMNRTAVEVVYKFVHASSGTDIEVTAIGEGADVGDKSANKASTGAYKYALRQAFVIETGDDPDNDASEPRASSPKATPRPSNNGKAKESSEPTTNGTGKSAERPWTADVVRDALRKSAAQHDAAGRAPSEGQLKMMAANLEQLFPGQDRATDKRRAITEYVFGQSSTKELTDGEALALVRWCNYTKDDETGDWIPDFMAIHEGEAIYTAHMKEQGQAELL